MPVSKHYGGHGLKVSRAMKEYYGETGGTEGKGWKPVFYATEKVLIKKGTKWRKKTRKGRNVNVASKYKPFYEVIVGNIGKVHEGTNLAAARRAYISYKSKSKSGVGRAAGENVTLWKDGDIIDEYEGSWELRNPSKRKSTRLTGAWIPAIAVRKVGRKLQILKNPRVKNISQGFWADGIFHPIRAAEDYDPRLVGEGGKKRKKRRKPAKKAAARRRTTTKKRATTKRRKTTRRR